MRYMESELYHHGILGMKWGVRRYQNEDGSLTDAGKKRYSKSLYKKLQKNPFRYGDSRYDNDEDLRKIAQDPSFKRARKERDDAIQRYVEAANRDKSEPYEAWNDPEVLKDAEKNFREDYPEWDKAPELHKRFDDYIDYSAERLGAYEKEKASRPLYESELEKANDKYSAFLKKYVSSVLGDYGDEPIKTTWGGPSQYEKYKDIVASILQLRY